MIFRSRDPNKFLSASQTNLTNRTYIILEPRTITFLADYAAVGMANINAEVGDETKDPPNLLTIPQEIRDEILLQALKANENILCHKSMGRTPGQIIGISPTYILRTASRTTRDNYCNLRYVCKQISNEAPIIFFKQNTFELRARHNIPKIPASHYMPKIPTNHFRLMKNIDIILPLKLRDLLVFAGSYRAARFRVSGPTVDTDVLQLRGTSGWKGSWVNATDDWWREHNTDCFYNSLEKALHILRTLLHSGHPIDTNIWQVALKDMYAAGTLTSQA